MTTSKDSRHPEPETATAMGVASEMGVSFAEPMSDEDAAEFRRRLAVAMKGPPTILPQRKPLSEDEVRQLLRECVTVIKPGETLVLRLGPDYTPRDVREISEAVRAWAGQDGWPRVMVLPGDELGVVKEPEGTSG